MSILNMISNTAKSLMGNKNIQQILRYLTSSTLGYLSKQYNISQYKYDIGDNRNMIYQYNNNHNEKINPLMSDMASNLYKIDRFLKECGIDNGAIGLINNLIKSSNNKVLEELKDNYINNTNLLNFDHDTLETSSIADNYEINSGGIYVPTETVTITPEGKQVADLKNEYLTNRMMLGENPSESEVYKLLQDYHTKNKTREVSEYFNSLL